MNKWLKGGGGVNTVLYALDCNGIAIQFWRKKLRGGAGMQYDMFSHYVEPP